MIRDALKLIGLLVVVVLAGSAGGISVMRFQEPPRALECGFSPNCFVRWLLPTGNPTNQRSAFSTEDACFRKSDAELIAKLAHTIRGDKSKAGDLNSELGPPSAGECFSLKKIVIASCKIHNGGMSGVQKCSELLPN